MFACLAKTLPLSAPGSWTLRCRGPTAESVTQALSDPATALKVGARGMSAGRDRLSLQPMVGTLRRTGEGQVTLHSCTGAAFEILSADGDQ
jgi:hypothetical protein